MVLEDLEVQVGPEGRQDQAPCEEAGPVAAAAVVVVEGWRGSCTETQTAQERVW